MHRHARIFVVLSLSLLAACAEAPGASEAESSEDTTSAVEAASRSETAVDHEANASRDTAVEPVRVDTAGAVPNATEPFYGVFAYADSSGDRLLAVSEPSHPDALLRGICRSGERIAVRFQGHQPRDEEHDSGRQTARNFDYDAGALFRVGRGEPRPGDTCFLVGPALLALSSPSRPERPPEKGCVPADSIRLAQARERALVSCTRLAVVGDTVRVLASVFEPKGDNALASVTLIDEVGLAHLDFPARQDPNATWRVADGGEFQTEHLDVLFVVSDRRGRAMALAWGGVEGESLMLALAPNAGTVFRLVVRGYRYWMAR